MVLGASNLTYVEPVLRQDLATWIGCHVNALAYFGGVPAALVPDNTKTGVTRPDYYDPELNPTYADLAQHYGTAILPARPYHPRDKATYTIRISAPSDLSALSNGVLESREGADEALGCGSVMARLIDAARVHDMVDAGLREQRRAGAAGRGQHQLEVP